MGIAASIIAFAASIANGPWQAAGHVVLGAVGVSAVLAGVVSRRASASTAWATMAGAIGLHAIGASLHAVGNEGASRTLVLMGTVGMVAGLALLNRRAKTRRDIQGLLDTLLATLAVGLVVWHVGAAQVTTASRAELATTMAATLFAIGGLALTGRLLIANRVARPPLIVMSLGLGMKFAGHLVADSGWAPLSVGTDTALLVATWGACMLGAAALQPQAEAIGRPMTNPGPVLGPARIALAGLSFVVPPMVLLRAPRLDRSMVAIMTVTIAALLVTRVSMVLTELDRSHRSTRRRDRWYRSLVTHSSDLLLVVAGDGKIRFASASVGAAMEQPTGEIVGRDVRSLFHTEDIDLLDETLDEIRCASTPTTGTTEPLSIELRLRSTEGPPTRWFEVTMSDQRTNDDLHGTVINAREISDRKARERELNSAYDKQASIAALGRAALSGHDTSELSRIAVEEIQRTLQVHSIELYQSINDGDLLVLEAATGPTDRLVGQRSLTVDDSSLAGYTRLLGETVVSNDLENDRRFRTELPVPGTPAARSGVSVCVNGADEIHGVLIASAVDTGAFTPQDTDFLATMANELALALQRRTSEELIRHQALHDALTGLPNRLLFQDRLTRLTHAADADDELIGLLFLDLDHFKEVNDTLGHDAGDELLCDVANRLRRATRPTDLVARLGGDEFVVLCEGLTSPEQAATVAKRVREQMEPTSQIKNTEIQISASIGIAVASAGSDTERLLNEADTAMYQAKQAGRSRYEIFDFSMRAESEQRLELESELRRAVTEHQLELHYQPIARLRDRQIIGFEGLLRWNHPERGLLTPDEFLPVAEQSDLAGLVSDWVLHDACAQLAQWQAQPDRASGHIAINLVASHVESGLADKVHDALVSAGADPHGLRLEVTETKIMSDVEQSLKVLGALDDLGIEISVDDFGTGYSSLAHLNRLPIHALKINRAFVTPSVENHDDAVAGAVIALGKSLDLQVIADGVQTEEEASRLVELGCHSGQGLLFGPPRPASEILF